ncbi:MAG: hypothetical protein U0V72_08720 [Cytophagales bacterium]
MNNVLLKYIILVLLGCMQAIARTYTPDSLYLKKKYPHSSYLATKSDNVGISLGKLPGLGLKDISFSGTFDFVGFYRNIPTGYPGLSTPKKNLEFTPYPSGSNFGGNFYRQPLLNLIISGSPSKNTSFAIEYAMSHFYTGLSGDSSRKFSVQNMLQLHGFTATKYGNFLLTAGGGALNYSLSPLTIFNKDFREPMFEKLPWDWYANSFEKYTDQYNSSATSTPSYISNSATQGFIVEGSEMPYKTGFSVFYGRSNFTLSPARVDSSFPSYIIAGKIYKGSDSSGKFVFNYYHQYGYINPSSSIKDAKGIYTTSFFKTTSRYRINCEVGIGKVQNPASDNHVGEAVSLNATVFNPKIKLPIQLQLYSLDKRVASMEAAYLNANPTVSQGGYSSEAKYNNAYYPSYLQEVGMLINNRQGGFLKIDKVFEKFRVEFGNAISVEKENLSNTVSFQHFANAFGRSRFKPWIQNTGPYQLINYRYRRTFETVALTDSGNYKKVYNTADLALKFKSKIFNKGIILSNYTYAGAVSKSFKVAPSLNSQSYIHTVYNETSAYFQIHKKLTLLAFYSVQMAKGNHNTQLSTENGNPVNQKSYGYGGGIDYDFSENAGIFLRHRWMSHKDQSFVLDNFKGQETIVELKIFF